MQPAELLIIGGARNGIVMAANSPAVICKMLRGIGSGLRERSPIRATAPLSAPR